MVHLRFALSINGTYHLCFLWEKLRGQSVLAVGRYLSVHMCKDDASTACTWEACHNKLKEIYQKRTETSLHKKSSKRNLADVGMAQYINALANKIHKQEVPCTQ